MAEVIIVPEDIRQQLIGASNHGIFVITSEDEMEKLGLKDDLKDGIIDEALEDYDCGGEADVWLDFFGSFAMEQVRAFKQAINNPIIDTDAQAERKQMGIHQ